MYCPHGRCKTRAYRARKSRETQRSADPAAPVSSVELPLPRAEPASPPAAVAPDERVFFHSLACTCGQRVLIQIQVSHAVAGAMLPLTLPHPVPAEASVAHEDSATDSTRAPAVIAIREEQRGAADPVSLSEVRPDPALSTSPGALSDPEASVIAQEPEASKVPSPAHEADSLHEESVEPAVPTAAPDSDSASPSVSTRSSPSSSNAVVSTSGFQSVEAKSSALLHPCVEDLLSPVFWETARDRPYGLLNKTQELQNAARLKGDLLGVERAYCRMALVHAIRRDRPRAWERLGQARTVALQRGDTAEVDQAEDQLRMILSPPSWEEDTEEDAEEDG